MVLAAGGSIVACGLGVLQGEYLGLFDIVTRDSERRKGYGREVTESLLAWGQSQDASYAYLQVMLSNTAAQALYGQLGFGERYQYWYRVPQQ
jgi:ribosomal protein S18 acetylase RimI-like enzyme